VIALAVALLAGRPEAKVNELVAALDRVLQGDPDALQGFGVEQRLFVQAGWEDTLSVDGQGQVAYLTHGSDRLGEDVGLFRAQLSPEELRPLLLGARALAAASLSPARAEAYDARVTLAVVAGGHHLRFTTAAQPAALQQLEPLSLPLQRALMKAVQHPVRALAISVAVPHGLVRGAPALFLLHLHNTGTEGMWVPNPAALANRKGGDRVAITWAPLLKRTPGVTPVPAVPQRALLAPETAAARPAHLWLAPKGDLDVPLVATLELPADLTELVLGAELVARDGDETLAGRPCFRGSLLSGDVVVQPR
jgi:hypothetical protein